MLQIRRIFGGLSARPGGYDRPRTSLAFMRYSRNCEGSNPLCSKKKENLLTANTKPMMTSLKPAFGLPQSWLIFSVKIRLKQADHPTTRKPHNMHDLGETKRLSMFDHDIRSCREQVCLPRTSRQLCLNKMSHTWTPADADQLWTHCL